MSVVIRDFCAHPGCSRWHVQYYEGGEECMEYWTEHYFNREHFGPLSYEEVVEVIAHRPRMDLFFTQMDVFYDVHTPAPRRWSERNHRLNLWSCAGVVLFGALIAALAVFVLPGLMVLLSRGLF